MKKIISVLALSAFIWVVFPDGFMCRVNGPVPVSHVGLLCINPA